MCFFLLGPCIISEVMTGSINERCPEDKLELAVIAHLQMRCLHRGSSAAVAWLCSCAPAESVCLLSRIIMRC